MARRWTCPKCKRPNDRIGGRRSCAYCATGRAPKRRVPAHAVTLRDDSYDTYSQAAASIHGVSDESCCVCGKPRSLERRHDRDHGHLQGSLSYGRPRGLACVSCNRLMVRELDAARCRLILAYLERVDAFYATEEAA